MEEEWMLTATTSTPWLASFFEESFETSRVIPRTAQPLNFGSARMVCTTEPPWPPVAPMMAMVFLSEDMMSELGLKFREGLLN